MPKTNIMQKEMEKERQETKTEIAAKIAELEKRQAVVDFQLKQMKDRKQIDTATAKASWVAGFAWLIYDELIMIYRAIGELSEAIYQTDSEISKVSGEWQRHRKILTKLKQAVNFTEEMFSENR